MAVVTSYSTLLTAVADWLARSDLTSFIPNFVQNWEEDFLRDPRNFGRWMEASLNVTIASSVAAVPADYLGLKYAYIDGSPSSALDRKSLNQLLGTYPRGGDTDLPVWISRGGSDFLFGPEPDSDYTVKGWYWAKPTAMRSAASDAQTHWIIVNAPDLAIYGSLKAAEPFVKNDKRFALWDGMYSSCLASYRALQRDEDVSGSPSQEVLA